VVKKKLQKYYCGGLVSLLGLPILFFSFYGKQIDTLLQKSTIEFTLPAVDGSFVEHFEYFPKERAKYTEYRYAFQPGNEAAQIEAFRKYHKNIEVKSSNDKYYFVVTVDMKCSYNLYVQVLDILDQIKYMYEYRGNVLYARRMSKEWTAQTINYKKIRRSNEIEWFKNVFPQLTRNQQLAVFLIGALWLALFVVVIRSRRNMFSAT